MESTLLSADDFLIGNESEDVNRSDTEIILSSVSPDALRAFSLLHRYALGLDPEYISCKLDGPCAFLYGIKKTSRMRPLVLRLALSPGYRRELLIKVDASASDRHGRFNSTVGTRGRRWKVMRYEVPIGGITQADIKYFIQQFIESYENTTERHAKLDPDAVLNGNSLEPTVIAASTQSMSHTDLHPATTLSHSLQIEPENSENLTDTQPETAIDEESIIISEDRSKVRWEDIKWSIREVYHHYKEGTLQLQPDFQRGYVWTPAIQRRFIESILMRLPIPVVYLAETVDDKYEVIDGQQRLTTIVNFIDGKFPLAKLSVLDELKGLRFKDLKPELQKLFHNYQIAGRVLDASCPPDLKFDMFERLNTGSVQLNKQELRNCICRGSFNSMLKELAAQKDFLSALGWKEPDARMKGEELILRFFTFFYSNVRSIRNYEKALTDYMREKANLSLERSRIHEKDFRESLAKCVSVFGERPFRSWARATGEKDPNGQWEARFSSTVFEILMTGLAHYSKQAVVENSDAIREEFINLVTTDQNFFDSLKWGTNTPEKMTRRNETWGNALRELLGYVGPETRCFTNSFKKQLWDSNPNCRICGQEIKTIEDAAVDHIVHYWRGGKTIPSNARLTHRYCNQSRGGRND